jgi:hypothetical protein
LREKCLTPLERRLVLRTLDCGGSVGIPTDNRTSAGKLRAILPVLIERWCSGTSNRHRCLADTSTFGGVEPEPHA